MAGLRELEGRAAVVTGASSGIGAALARALAARSARVALVARRRERLEAIAREIHAEGGEALALPCDVDEPESVAAAAAAADDALGPLDLLVNDAGFASHVLAADQPFAEVEALMRTNYLGAVAWIHAVLPGMRSRGRGWIVNVSSFAALVPQPDEAAYAASKAALTTYSESITHEVAREGIHVLTVHPTLVRTEMFTPEVMKRMPKGSERRFISAEAFAEATLRALARGRTTAVVPGTMALMPALRALAPEWFGRALARVKLAALETPEA